MTTSTMRLILGLIAGALASHGYIKPEESSIWIDQMLPLAMTIVTVVWSWWEKQGQAALLDAARRLPAGVPLEIVKQEAKK